MVIKGKSNSGSFKKGTIPWNKGKTGIYSEETKKKMSVSQFKKGQVPHNKGKKGPASPNKGKKATPEQKKKMIEAMNRPDVKRKLSESKKGAKNPMYGKPAHNRGKSPSDETKRKLSKSVKNSLEGKIYSVEERAKRSKRAKAWFAIHGSNRKGKQDSVETFRKKSLAQKGKKKSDEWKKKIGLGNKGKIRSKETKMKISASRAKQVFPTKDTKIELITQSILKKNKIDFMKHKNFKLSRSNHQADIVIEPNKVIEVNGDYWHFNPKKYDGNSIQKKRGKTIRVNEVWKNDEYIIEGMKKQGYKVLVVWESELINELNDITKKILKFAKS